MAGRNLTDDDVAAIVQALKTEEFTEEERVVIKRWIRFFNRVSTGVGMFVILGILGAIGTLINLGLNAWRGQ